jgi:predicted metal-dependent phosphoesterase TrpH
MKADLHVHSCYSNDGKSTPQEIVDRAIEIGLGCVAITDHNSFKAYFDVKDNGKIIIIPGEEVSSKEGHILAFGIDKEIPSGLSIQDTIDAIHEAGGYAFVAHPYRWWSGLGEKNTLQYDFDGTEARNARSVHNANRRSEKLASKMGKPISAGSDAHTPPRIGSGYAEFPDGLTTWQEVLDYMMNNRVSVDSNSRGRVGTIRYATKSIGQWMFRGFKKM